MSRQSGPNTGFEFGWRYERIKLLEHHKRLNILKADGSSVFCFMLSLDKHTFFQRRLLLLCTTFFEYGL